MLTSLCNVVHGLPKIKLNVKVYQSNLMPNLTSIAALVSKQGYYY